MYLRKLWSNEKSAVLLSADSRVYIIIIAKIHHTTIKLFVEGHNIVLM